MEKLLEAVIKTLSDLVARVRYRSRIEIAAEALKYEVLKGGSRGWLKRS
jgi:hypothetical protein